MHFYTKHIGDFNAATRHLTRIERSIYSDMIELYYDTEKPLISDVEKLCRLIAAHSDEEKKAVQNVLADFFTLTADGWFNKRCDEEIQRIYSKSEKARQSAKSRWNRSNDGSEHYQNANALRTDSEGNAFGMLPINPLTQYKTPLSSNDDIPPQMQTQSDGNANASTPEKVKKPKQPDTVPYQQVADLYNRICIDLPRCTQLNDKRKSAIRARWNSPNSNGEYTRRSLEWWEKFFTKVHKSDFLCGRQKGSDFKANFDFTVTESKFINICEGTYDNKGGR